MKRRRRSLNAFEARAMTINNTVCIRDLDKLNLDVVVDFRLEPRGSQSFSARVPQGRKKKTRVPLSTCEKEFSEIFIENLCVNLKMAYPLRFLTYPRGYAYPRLGTAALRNVAHIKSGQK